MATFDYRRDLSRAEEARTLAAGVGAGIAAGLAAVYVARVLLQRTPVTPTGAPSAPALEAREARRSLTL